MQLHTDNSQAADPREHPHRKKMLVESAYEAGRSAARDEIENRINAVLTHPGVKGREGPALKLAIASPDLSANEVVAFVSGHMSSTPALEDWTTNAQPC